MEKRNGFRRTWQGSWAQCAVVRTGKLEVGQGEAGNPLWLVSVAYLALLCFIPNWMLGGRKEDGETGKLAVADQVPVLWG